MFFLFFRIFLLVFCPVVPRSFVLYFRPCHVAPHFSSIYPLSRILSVCCLICSPTCTTHGCCFFSFANEKTTPAALGNWNWNTPRFVVVSWKILHITPLLLCAWWWWWMQWASWRGGCRSSTPGQQWGCARKRGYIIDLLLSFGIFILSCCSPTLWHLLFSLHWRLGGGGGGRTVFYFRFWLHFTGILAQPNRLGGVCSLQLG